MIQQIIHLNLTGRQVREICENGWNEKTESEAETTPPHIRGFVRSMQKMADEDEEEFYHRLLKEEGTPALAQARVDSIIAFLIRIKNRL